MSRPAIIFFFLFLYQTTGFAQSQVDETGIEGNNLTDTILYTHDVTLSPDSLASWKAEKKFSYVNNLDSLLRAKEKEFMGENKPAQRNASPSFLQRFFSLGIVRFVFWGLAAAIVLFILYRLFISQGVFKRNTSSAAVKEMEDEQEKWDANADYDALIRQSVRLNDYRMAVRYLFLKTLSQLSDKGLVQRSADKTNFQYVQEIPSVKRKEFASLVLNYEYVWYGRLEITSEQYARLEKNYVSFYNKI